MASNRKKTWALIIFAVVVIAGIILYAATRGPAGAPPAPGGGGTAQSSTVGVAQFAPKGELAPGFPQSLILDGNAAPDGSYKINYSTTSNQYTAEWNSSSSMTELFAAYKAYFPAHGWTITASNEQLPNFRGIFAKNATSTVSADILKAGSGAQISVTYVTK